MSFIVETGSEALRLVMPLIGVGVGWGLTEFSQVVRNSREKKKGVGKVLADLLEIHHRYRALDLVVGESAKIPLSGADQAVLADAMKKLVWHQLDDLHKRYEESVSLLAETAPVLAFRLRYQSSAPSMLERLRVLASSSGASAIEFSEIEKRMTKLAISNLEGLILRVARSFGLKTWLELRKRMKKGVDPAELEKMIEELTGQKISI